MKRFPTVEQRESLDDLFYKGQQSKLLRNNPTFQWAVEKVYHDLVVAEDSVTGDASVESREANDQRRNFSGMRVGLVALIEKLDEVIHLAETDTNNPINNENSGEK